MLTSGRPSGASSSSARGGRGSRSAAGPTATGARKTSNVAWVLRADGQRDQRYTMPQVVRADGGRDQRYSTLQAPQFSAWNPLTQGRSQTYQSQPVQPGVPGVYEISTRQPGVVGRPNVQYAGMDSHLGRRGNDHGRGGSDNIADLVARAANQGLNTQIRYAQANSVAEARAQELYLLDQSLYSWNSQNNEGRFAGETTRSKIQDHV